jgi:hypothetical protein
VLVLAPPIFPKLGAFSCGYCFGHGLNISMTIGVRKYQFGQYFARNRIILQYRFDCNAERHGTGNSTWGPARSEKFNPDQKISAEFIHLRCKNQKENC